MYIKLAELLTEIVDIYSPKELESKGIQFEIEKDSARRFIVNLKYIDQYYSLRILPVFNPNRSSVNFGNTDSNYKSINLDTLLNSPYSFRILASIFGLVRYWVDRYSIQEFEYVAEGNVRLTIYNYYLTKHFSDFKNYEVSFGDETLQVWKRI